MCVLAWMLDDSVHYVYTQAVQFAKNYATLTDMGFTPVKAAGCLVKHRNDVAQAADMATALA